MINDTDKEFKRLAIVTFPTGDAKGSHLLLKRFLLVIEPLGQQIYVITGNYPSESIFSAKILVNNIIHKPGNGFFSKGFKYAQTQLRLAFNLLRVINKVDIVIYFIGGALIPSMLIAKLFRKKIVLITTGSGRESARWIYKDVKLFAKILSFLERLGYWLSDRIIVYSSSFIDYLGLKKYTYKISLSNEHFLDFSNFKVNKSLDARGKVIGYVGRLSEEKGIMNFVKAIPEVIKRQPGVQFIIGGDGYKREEILKFLRQEELDDNVKLLGWIPHERVSQYLNEFKLLVLPSYTEELPNVILEAMACGTPVLASSVGAIPDIIIDGNTGFLMANNSPECISENIIRALNYPEVGKILKNARNFVEKEFTFEKVVENNRKILSIL